MKTDSAGSRQIESLLHTRGVNFKKEIPLCQGVRGGILRADFAIYGLKDDPVAVIEFDGTQHLTRSNCVELDIAIANDAIKDEFCLEHGIRLMRISYPKSGESIDTEAINDFLSAVIDAEPAVKTGVVAEFTTKRSLNLLPVELEDLRMPSYSLAEVSSLINRNVSHIWNRYVLGLGLLQNWSGKSSFIRARSSVIAREDLIRFLVEQEALFQSNRQLTISSPEVIYAIGDLTPKIETLIIVHDLSEVGDLISEAEFNLGLVTIRVVGGEEWQQLGEMYDILRQLGSGQFANLLVSERLSKDLIRELELNSGERFVRVHRPCKK